jgi:hydrogenase expression/formation protein HypC
MDIFVSLLYLLSEDPMCLGVPGKVIEIYETEGLKMGKIDFGGVVREACLAYVPEIEVGEYTVIHVGFAISQLSEEEAQATLEILNELADLEEEIGPETGARPGEIQPSL